MQRRNITIAVLLTILIALIIVAAFAPSSDPIVRPVSPLLFQSPIDVTLTRQSYAPVIMLDFCCTPTARPTLPGPTDTPTPRPTP